MSSGSKNIGALPSQTIKDLIKGGFILNARPENVRPSSLDLSLADEVYEVEGIFQPRAGEPVREVLAKIEKKSFSFDRPLQKDQMYIARLNETFNLPETVYAICNPKSTSGRLDVHVRLIADGVSRYDVISPAGWSGEVWVSIIPKTFPVILYPEQSLNQLRFFNADTRLDNLELEIAIKQHSLIWNSRTNTPLTYEQMFARDNDHSILLTIDLEGEMVGYQGKKVDEPIDTKKIGSYKASDFFEPLVKEKDFLYLKKGEFYILSTFEAVRVPPEFACEMVSMDERSGEFRSHYAGFIDPGWGFGKDGEGMGRQLTLEVRPFEDLIVRHRQPIAKIKFERLINLPETVYDGLDSNYLNQVGPKLSKHFK